MFSKRVSKSIVKFIIHKNKFNACLNDIKNKNYSLKEEWWIWELFGF
jgi:hypothetical protein